MGQRSQTYIRLENIGKVWAKRTQLDKPKAAKWRNNLPEYVRLQELYDKWKLMYGDEDTIILALHHQWLYGRSFVLTASRLLHLVKSCYGARRSENNILSKDFWKNGTPYDEKKFIDFENPNTVISWIEGYLSNMFDPQLDQYARTGIEWFTNLNEEHDPTDTWSYYDSFTHGDNNDGVLIVDATTQKYCFVEINSSEDKQELFPYLKPVPAENYLKQYYGEEVIGEIDVDTAVKNANINALFNERFKEYSVLSVEELIAIFPGMKTELNKINNPKKKKKEKV